MTCREWEVFEDICYFEIWAVRPVGDKNFDSPQLFHFVKRDDAIAFAELARKAHVAVPEKVG